jgi:hypothetical protein
MVLRQDFEKVIEVWFIQEDSSARGDIIDPRFLEQHDIEANVPPQEGVAGPDDDVQDRNFKVDKVRSFSVEQGFKVTAVEAG